MDVSGSPRPSSSEAAGVPQVVEAPPGEARGAERGLEAARVHGTGQRLAVLTAEHEAPPLTPPTGASAQPILALTRPVAAQRLADLRRQRDGAAAAQGLRLHQTVLAVVALKAVAHGERTSVEVHVIPGQAQRLALSQPERQRHVIRRLEAITAPSIIGPAPLRSRAARISRSAAGERRPG